MKKGDLINTELISVANVFECTNIKYKTRNILVLVAGPGSDGSYMLDMAKNLSKYGNVYVIVQEIFRGKYKLGDKINPKEHLNDLIIETAKDLLHFERKNDLKNIVTVNHCLMGLIALYYGEISNNVKKSILISAPVTSPSLSFEKVIKLLFCLIKNGFTKASKDPEIAKKVMLEYILWISNTHIYNKKSKKSLQLFVDSLKDISPHLAQSFIKDGVKPHPNLSRLIPNKREVKQSIVCIDGEFEEISEKNDYTILKDYLESKSYKNIDRIIIPKTKHFCFMENPTFFTKVIKNCLE